MNGMIFRLFRKRNSSQKNTNTVYSEYSWSRIVPKERALNWFVLVTVSSEKGDAFDVVVTSALKLTEVSHIMIFLFQFTASRV